MVNKSFIEIPVGSEFRRPGGFVQTQRWPLDAALQCARSFSGLCGSLRCSARAIPPTFAPVPEVSNRAAAPSNNV